MGKEAFAVIRRFCIVKEFLITTTVPCLFVALSTLAGCSEHSAEGNTEVREQALASASDAKRKKPVGKPRFVYVSQNNYLQIVSHEGERSAYIGCFNCDFGSPESIFNPNGFFYSRLTPINSEYGGTFSDKSMCNFAATNPPHLEMWGNPYSLGDLRASVNEFHSGSICNQFSTSYWETGCKHLKQLCGT